MLWMEMTKNKIAQLMNLLSSRKGKPGTIKQAMVTKDSAPAPTREVWDAMTEFIQGVPVREGSYEGLMVKQPATVRWDQQRGRGQYSGQRREWIPRPKVKSTASEELKEIQYDCDRVRLNMSGQRKLIRKRDWPLKKEAQICPVEGSLEAVVRGARLDAELPGGMAQ